MGYIHVSSTEQVACLKKRRLDKLSACMTAIMLTKLLNWNQYSFNIRLFLATEAGFSPENCDAGNAEKLAEYIIKGQVYELNFSLK